MTLPQFYIDEIIKTALKEDINYIDITTDLLIDENNSSTAFFIAKANGVISGLMVALRVFEILDKDIQSKIFFKDGEKIKSGDIIAKLSGKTTALLKGERTALNFLQHMSGISTYTAKCVSLISGTKARITDTRKTLAGLRRLQKYAVLMGGGYNHRYNLSDAAMLKDNHIDAYTSITKAAEALRQKAGHMINIEVEVRDFDELREALSAGVSVIMLDNMTPEQMHKAVEFAGEYAVVNSKTRVLLEASGNITEKNISEIAKTGVDIISLGVLTHSVKAFDISMKWDRQYSEG